MATVKFLDQTGHTTMEFGEGKQFTQAEALAKIDAAVKSGAVIAKKTGDGTFEKLPKGFDPTAEETLVIPQLVGG